QWRHQKFRIERDRKIAAFVLHWQRFLGFADFRSVGGDVDVVFSEAELDRIRFLARQKRHAPQGIQKRLALEGHALLGFPWNNLFVIWIIAFDQLRDEQRLV